MKAKTKNSYIKYAAIVFAIIFLVSAALLIIKSWERQQGQFPSSDGEDNSIMYKNEKYVLKDKIETFLVLGLDKFKGASSSASHASGTVQADFLMLFVFDNEAQKTTAISINRDTIANVNRLDIVGNKTGIVEQKQIALAYNFAYDDKGLVNCRNTADSVSDLLMDVKIDHYISLTMDAAIEINDFVGGVEVTVLDDFTGIDDMLVKGSTVTLKGQQALTYVRSRKGLEDSTNTNRMKRQQQYIDAFTKKVNESITTNDDFAISFVTKLMPYLEYNSTEYRLKEFAEKFDKYEFEGIINIEGESKVGEEFMEFYPDRNSIKEIVIDLFYTPETSK